MTIDKNGNLINSVEIPYNEFGSHIAVGADGAIYFSCGKQFCGIK